MKIDWSKHPCGYHWITIKHEDGSLHQVCEACGEDAGPLLLSGYEAGDCSEAVTIMPMQPVFWDAQKKREWFTEWVAERTSNGAHVSPEAWAASLEAW